MILAVHVPLCLSENTKRGNSAAKRRNIALLNNVTTAEAKGEV